MDCKAKSSCQVEERIKSSFLLNLAQGNNLRQHRTVQQELYLRGLVPLNSVLPDNGEQERLVSKVLGPKGTHPLSGWLDVQTLSQDVSKSPRGGVKSAGGEGAHASTVT